MLEYFTTNPLITFRDKNSLSSVTLDFHTSFQVQASPSPHPTPHHGCCRMGAWAGVFLWLLQGGASTEMFPLALKSYRWWSAPTPQWPPHVSHAGLPYSEPSPGWAGEWRKQTCQIAWFREQCMPGNPTQCGPPSLGRHVFSGKKIWVRGKEGMHCSQALGAMRNSHSS